MKIYLKLSLIILTFLAGIQLRAQMPPYVTVDVTVISETGIPIEGVDVIGRFPIRSDLNIPAPRGTTDSEGQVSLRERAVSTIRIEANKTGFYPSSVDAPHHYKWNSETQENEFFDVKTIVTLREIRNPVPMYAGRIKSAFPTPSGGRYGFDLLERDWVAPHGEGEIVDIWITLDFEYNNQNDYEINLKWEFEGPGNGIQSFVPPIPSNLFKSPHEGAEGGYKPEMTWTWYRRPNPDASGRRGDPRILHHNDFESSNAWQNPERFYMIRIRAQKDEDGEIQGGFYGKIYSSGSLTLAVEGKQNSEIFTGVIYINPTEGDRSIEFDPDQNLLNQLPNRFQPFFP